MKPPTTDLTVAIQGAAGSFGHAAALALYGPGVELLPCNSFEDLFAAVSDGHAERGMIPIENSLAGSVHRNYDLLSEHSLQIVGETRVRVRLCLIANRSTTLEQLRSISSHPVALAQCRTFFAQNPALRQVATMSTAGAVRDVLNSNNNSEAAIGSSLAATLYNGRILREDLEDHEENYTRFFAIAQPGASAAGGSKFSLVFTLPNNPGALHKALGVFAERGIDLARLESRPIVGKPWQYLFYLDCVAADAVTVTGALAALDEMALSLRVLGSYEPARQLHT